jgi:hypothetical protein
MAKHGFQPAGGWRFGNTIDGAQAEYLLVPDAKANLSAISDGLTDEQVLMCPDRLYRLLQSAMTILASIKLPNNSASKHSFLNVPLRLSLLPFCHGFPGSMVAILIPSLFIQRWRSSAIRSAPLSLRMALGQP